jgi:adenylylsulfate kinase
LYSNSSVGKRVQILAQSPHGVIAHYGGVPFKMKWYEKSISAVLASNLVVDKNYRKQVGKQYTKFLRLIIEKKVNVLFSVVGLFHELHKYNRKQLKNYIEILIDANFKKTELRKQKFFYKKKINNVWGRDIEPEYPKKPHIVLKNDFKKNKNSLSIELIKKINNLRFKFI